MPGQIRTPLEFSNQWLSKSFSFHWTDASGLMLHLCMIYFLMAQRLKRHHIQKSGVNNVLTYRQQRKLRRN